MARKPRRRRDDLSIPNRVFRDPVGELFRLPSTPFAVRSPLIEVEDRRTWSPEPILDDQPRTPRRPARIVQAKPRTRRPGRQAKSPYSITSGLQTRLAFKTPEHVLICVRRKRRREVLLALGKGGGGKRPPRRNQYSNVRC